MSKKRKYSEVYASFGFLSTLNMTEHKNHTGLLV
jgi:hypothetical protein